MADTPKTPSDSSVEEVEALSASEAGGVVDAIDRHRTKILFAVLAGAILFCAVLVTGQLKKQKHLEASAAYTEAVTEREIAALDGVVVNYPGSIPAGNALLSKAEIQIRQGKSEDAAKTFETFLADYSNHPRKAHGYFALGNLFHQSGDAAKATENYEKTIEIQSDGELTPLARIRLGDLALEAGDTDSADQRYQESYTLHPDNPFFEYAQEKIELLKIGSPTVVERPKPEPKPEPKAVEKPAEIKAQPKPATQSKPQAKPESKPAPKSKGKSKGKGKGKSKGKAGAKAGPKGNPDKKPAPKAKAPAAPKTAATPAPKAAK